MRTDRLDEIYFWQTDRWTTSKTIRMPQNHDAPVGAATDFHHLTPFEREKAEAMRRMQLDPDRDGLAEIEAEQARLKKAREDHEKFIAGQSSAGPAPRGKIYHLLCAKSAPKKIRVVGMYSSVEELATAIAAGAGPYSTAGQSLGVVEFDISIKVDQPPVDPLV